MAHQIDDKNGRIRSTDDTPDENKPQVLDDTNATSTSTAASKNADSEETQETFSRLSLSDQDLDDAKHSNSTPSNTQSQPQQQILSPVIEHVDEGSNEYQIHIRNADDVNGDLNGLYTIELNEDKIPQILHKQNSLFTPNFMYYFKSPSTQNEYAIFIIPSLESIQLYKPTWVIAQLNHQHENQNVHQPIYYYAQRVDFSQENAMQVPQNGGWVIVGADDPQQQSLMCTMQLTVVRLKPLAQRQADFAQRQQMSTSGRDDGAEQKQMPMHAHEEHEVKSQQQKSEQSQRIFEDAEDVKVQCVEMVGHENILKVTDDLQELKTEWYASELGNHDELEMFLGAIGKIVDIEEDDDTVKLEWINNDCHWLPARACWITWSTSKVTAPNFYPDQDEENDDTKVLQAAFLDNNND
eukprot:CAMPEP_0202730058 /NCGR_PEP_ID=MMETSP1385-20130828/186449_1 /ASSEMBLY_ACC=CAM_ASM_000861 /TAXON_ID=933848 /ORGANISM="Elphidium margaritaceum" /LENGTH=409 /DNA_ID=CAMNT_0049396331 /DNA_START=423 /DNA_END=1650 /DNA_ORIENTATION=+